MNHEKYPRQNNTFLNTININSNSRKYNRSISAQPPLMPELRNSKIFSPRPNKKIKLEPIKTTPIFSLKPTRKPFFNNYTKNYTKNKLPEIPPLNLKDITNTYTNNYSKPNYPLSKYPYLNPIFNIRETQPIIDNKFKEKFNKTYKTFSSNNRNDEIDELWYQYNQRELIKSNSAKIVEMAKKKNDILSKGDLVNIDKKTLIYKYFDNNTGLYNFSELLNNNIHSYDLSTKKYEILFNSNNKSDLDDSCLSEGYLSELESGKRYNSDFSDIELSSMDTSDSDSNTADKLINMEEEIDKVSNDTISDKLELEIAETLLSLKDINIDNITESSFYKDSIIPEYVISSNNIESIYNIDSTNQKPKIIIHQEKSNKEEKVEQSEENLKIVENLLEEITKNAITNATKIIKSSDDKDKILEDKIICKDEVTDSKILDDNTDCTIVDKTDHKNESWCVLM